MPSSRMPSSWMPSSLCLVHEWLDNIMSRFLNPWITLCLDNIRVNWMPRQCISKRNKNIKEREKTYNPVTF